MLPLLPILAAAQIAGAVANTAGNVAGAGNIYTDEMAKRQKELEDLRKRGALGLSQAEQQAMEAQTTAAVGGMTRQQQANALQQAAMMSGAGPTSGRELFLADQARAQAEGQVRAQAARDMAAADAQAKAAQKAELEALAQAQADEKAARRQAILQGVGQILGAGGAVAGQAIGIQQQQRQFNQQMAMYGAQQQVSPEAVQLMQNVYGVGG